MSRTYRHITSAGQCSDYLKLLITNDLINDLNASAKWIHIRSVHELILMYTKDGSCLNYSKVPKKFKRSINRRKRKRDNNLIKQSLINDSFDNLPYFKWFNDAFYLWD